MIRSLTDPERFRVLWDRGGRWSPRRYVDREPADGTWGADRRSKDKLINCTTVARGGILRCLLQEGRIVLVPLDALRVATTDPNGREPRAPRRHGVRRAHRGDGDRRDPRPNRGRRARHRRASLIERSSRASRR